MGNYVLEPRQELFVREYVKDYNGAKAALRAGYSKKTAAAQASRLLTKANVKSLLQEIQEEIKHFNRVTIQKIIAENSRIAFSDLKDYVKWGPTGVKMLDHTNVDTRCVESVEIIPGAFGNKMKIKLYDKGAALERLGQFLGAKAKGEKPPDFTINIHVGDDDKSAIGIEYSIDQQ
jgi:phage terminase small subunit